jgi:hypothetical protein
MDTPNGQASATKARKFYIERPATSREELSQADQKAYDGLTTYVPEENLGAAQAAFLATRTIKVEAQRTHRKLAALVERRGILLGAAAGIMSNLAGVNAAIAEAQADPGAKINLRNLFSRHEVKAFGGNSPEGEGESESESSAPVSALSAEDLDTAAVLSGLIADALATPPADESTDEQPGEGEGGDGNDPTNNVAPEGSDTAADAGAGEGDGPGSDEGEKVGAGAGKGGKKK